LRETVQRRPTADVRMSRETWSTLPPKISVTRAAFAVASTDTSVATRRRPGSERNSVETVNRSSPMRLASAPSLSLLSSSLVSAARDSADAPRKAMVIS
jgi:hypothetical protein